MKISNKLQLSVIWNPVCSGADIFCKGVGGFDVQLFIKHRKRRETIYFIFEEKQTHKEKYVPFQASSHVDVFTETDNNRRREN